LQISLVKSKKESIAFLFKLFRWQFY
jgi:hypothetical protein